MSQDPYGNRKNDVFTQMLRTCMGDYLKDNLKTSVPGNVLSFDPATQMAQIQIGLKMHKATGEQEDRSPAIYVPVQFWGGSGGTLECKVSAGDEGMLLFSQECIDSWVDQGGVAVKSEPRRFSQNDAVFIPGVRSIPGAISDFTNNGIRLRNKAGSSYYWIKDDGSVEVGGTKFVVKCPMEAEGISTFKEAVLTEATITNQGVSIGIDHRHIGVTAGNQTSGTVSP